jgi:hypothetical protein
MDEMDIRDRNIVSPNEPCGFHFLSKRAESAKVWRRNKVVFPWEEAGESPPSLWEGLRAIKQVAKERRRGADSRSDTFGPSVSFVPIESITRSEPVEVE